MAAAATVAMVMVVVAVAVMVASCLHHPLRSLPTPSPSHRPHCCHPPWGRHLAEATPTVALAVGVGS